MKKVLDKQHTLIYTTHYPWQIDACKRREHSNEHKAILGIGGNIGNVVRRFEHLYWFLKRSRHVTLLESAPILKNPPFGFLQQPDFYNSLLLVSTFLTPRQLLRYLLRVEKRFGRRRLIKDGPRTLDIDIIFYDDIHMDSKELKIPHPAWMQRNSVLIPLQMMKGRR
ncbi:MAG: 2-amino-4-hydroxy-6-hydroxymethyldihydropteridine diphosphokinase [Campylobacterota bacterium]|nr:2-amino-4-hydroxy-6-hydroxymethyldihydropteridine diphosphokinase [Campylobacterota bacterium]